MQHSFARGLDDLAGDDIRRWRDERPPLARAVRRGRKGGWMRRWLEGLMPDWTCRRPMRRTFVLQPVPTSDPASIHAPPHLPGSVRR